MTSIRGNNEHGTHVVVGDVIPIVDMIDESHGLPAEVAREVADQLLRSLATLSILPEEVRFSGYDDYGNEEHRLKDAGEFGTGLENSVYGPEATGIPAGDERGGRNQYFFTEHTALDDGEEGPFAFAASGDAPVVGVYSFAALEALGYTDSEGTVLATPEQVLHAMVMAFHPQYDHQG